MRRVNYLNDLMGYEEEVALIRKSDVAIHYTSGRNVFSETALDIERES